MTERFLPVVGYEGLYEISDIGTVRSITRKVRARKGMRTQKGRTLRPGFIYGYPVVSLWNDGKQSMRYVHRLILEAFVGPCPEGCESLHGNGVRSDCRLENLRWGTRKDNVQDAIRHGTAAVGERNAGALLTNAQANEIRRLNASGLTPTQCSRLFPQVKITTILRILSNRAYKNHLCTN